MKRNKIGESQEVRSCKLAYSFDLQRILKRVDRKTIMEEILNEVKTYDIAKLRQKLTENGVDVGPIGPSSMYLFQRSLARKLYESRGGRLEEHNEDTDTKTPDIAVSERSESNNVSTQKLPDVFYAVCLPENVDPQVKNEGKYFGLYWLMTSSYQVVVLTIECLTWHE